MLMKKRTNTDALSKAMQNAGIKQSLSELKNLETFNRSNVEPILHSIVDIISCYNCTPCNCLKKRIKKVLINSFYGNYNSNDVKYAAKALIAEIEVFLNSQNESKNPKKE